MQTDSDTGVIVTRSAEGIVDIRLNRPDRLNALGVTGAKRVPSASNIPTISEAGVPGYEVPVWYGFLAPRGTPRTIVGKLHTGIAKAMAMPELRERYLNEGGDATVRGPDEFAAIIHEQLPKWAKVVKDSGVKLE